MNPWTGLGLGVSLVFFGVPALFVASASWRLSDLRPHERRRLIRSSLSASALFATVGAIAGALAAALTTNAIATFVVTVSLPGALAVWSLRAAAPLATIRRLGAQLEHPAQRAIARSQLRALADELPRDLAGDKMRVAAATVLSNAGFENDALALIDKIDDGAFATHTRELRRMLLFSAQVSTRQLDAARATLATLPDFAEDDPHAAAKRVITARLLVVEGRPSEAVALIREPCARIESERGRRVALAHAYAAMGELRSLEETLDWLAGQPRGLERVIEPEGPATAAAMARMQRGPYGR